MGSRIAEIGTIASILQFVPHLWAWGEGNVYPALARWVKLCRAGGAYGDFFLTPGQLSSSNKRFDGSDFFQDTLK